MMTVKTILIADTIYSIASLALYVAALLIYRWWKKRREVPEPQTEPIAHCYHCADCHRPIRPDLIKSGAMVRCLIGGHLCMRCSSSHHDEAR